MASIIAEIQKLDNEFDEKEEGEKKEREETTNWIKEMMEQMKRENELKQREWNLKWAEKEKQDKSRDKRIEDSERRDRRENIIVTGFKMKEEELKSNQESWLYETLNIEVILMKAWEVKGRAGQKIIGAECETETMERNIMLNKNKLKGQEIYIDKDLTWKRRETRRKLREKAKEAKDQGKKAVVEGDILIIESEIYK
ncbi:hypothetical protein QAD02_013744 [Eretmocerus hayati]|uniref:Uncharacterized protein n=1 Tax=Eretmocerus hayati TaxID=131215 RepID=A0ACC2P3L7_9HYME|nr:hypothetical protein QAD02_013744 [Eretmocerus hayati]